MQSTKLKEYCPTCKKIAKEKKRLVIKNKLVIFLICGHGYNEEIEQVKEDELTQLRSKRKGDSLRKYQIESIKFAEDSNFKTGIFHEQGLGKTIIATVALALHKKLLPALILTKSSTKHQWLHELVDWGYGKLIPQIIDSSLAKPYDLFNVYITSVDMLRRLKWLDEFSPKTVIIDECQSIKNPGADRTKEVRDICSRAEYVMALSGTPFKNQALEYFTILNILQPEIFYDKNAYMQEYLHYTRSGYSFKVGGLKYPEKFKEATKHFIIRYTREQVAPELPKVTRQFEYFDLGDKTAQAYGQIVKEFQRFYEKEGARAFSSWSKNLEFINKMRHITGLAKIEPTLEFTSEFLTNNPNRKLTLFVHHKDVGRILYDMLNELAKSTGLPEPLRLSADLNGEQRQDIVSLFSSNPKQRLLIASSLAAGEGLNLQACSDCVIVERQWNPANEEQLEGRFARIGQKADAIFATYITATGTIDEYFAELVEKKRQIFKQTMDGENYRWDETSIMKDLMEVIAQRGYSVM